MTDYAAKYPGLQFDMRPVYRWTPWLNKWVFVASGRMVTPCKWKFGT